VTIGIIACVEVTTTTTTTTTTTLASSTTTITTTIPPSSATTTSGTTTLPTSVQTAANCQKDMAQVGGVYVSSVTYSVQPVPGTNNVDLTNPTSNGIDFPQPVGTTGLFDDQTNQPIYTIIFTFNPSGVNSLSSIIANNDSNVEQFSVEFYGLSNPSELITYPTDAGAIPVSYNSTFTNSQASLTNFPEDTPSNLSGILITILSTTDNA
jgi:hypothetical protein